MFTMRHAHGERDRGVMAILWSLRIDLKILVTDIATVFIYEKGDKTKLANMLFAFDKKASKRTIVLGAPRMLAAV